MDTKFRIDKGSNHVQLPVFVNNEGPFDFTLDTGATATSLSSSLTDKLGIESTPDDIGRWNNTKLPHKIARVNSLKIGSFAIRDNHVMVLDFASALGGCANNIGGVIGYTTLKDYLVTVDYRNHTFRLDESNARNYDKLNWCEFRYIDDTHLVGVPVKINNEGPFTFVIDTGAGGTVISTTLAKNLGLAMNPSEIICRGMGGDTKGYVVAIDQLSIDSVSQEMIYVIALNLDEVSPRGCVIRDGILGHPFLKDFRFVIDYPNRRFALDS